MNTELTLSGEIKGPISTKEDRTMSVPSATQEPSIAQMLQGALASGITKDNADALGKMMELYERMESRKAEQLFNSAFAALQSELPVIVASSVIPNRGKYERFEDVMRVVQPLLNKHGFAISFSQQADEKRITVTCFLRHAGGHYTANPFAVRLGGKADSETQADCKASTTAKRNALLQALNIVIRQDFLQDEDNPTNECGYITPAQAIELADWVESIGADRTKFLEYAGAKTFETIHEARYDDLVAVLRKKEKK